MENPRVWQKNGIADFEVNEISTISIFQKQPPPGVFYKKDVIKNVLNFAGKQLCWSLFLTTLQAWSPKNPPQLFSYKIFEISKNTHFEEYLQTTASGEVSPV